MKSQLKLSLIILSIAFYGCKQQEETVFSDYKYANEEHVITCSDLDTKIYNEALYAFEADILNFYQRENSDIRGAYSVFLKAVANKQIVYEDIVTPHTMKVLQGLKNKPELWNGNQLNYSAPFFKCLTDNFVATGIVPTINALIKTNSVRTDILAPPLQKYIKSAATDRYLATFIAFNMYYSQLVNIDAKKVSRKHEMASENVNK